MNSIWLLNYYLTDTKDKGKILHKVLFQMDKMSPLIVCETLEKLLCYYDLFDLEMKVQFNTLISKMKGCHFCKRCCKTELWWTRFATVVAEFEKLISIKRRPKCSLEPKIAVIVPNYLSANSFLQPPVDMLMSLKHLRDGGFDTIFIDNRVHNYPIERLYKKIETCEYVLITTTPYDHIQNYFLDYRLKYVFLLINYIKQQDDRKKVVVCGAHGSIRPDIVFNECEADYIVRGEYDFLIDNIFVDIFNNKEINSEFVLDRTRYKVAEIKKYTHDTMAYISRKDDMPYYECIDFSAYFGDNYSNNTLKRVNNFGAILASRGCMNSCNFCFNFFGNNVRYRTPESVVDEMQYMQMRGVKGLFFMDATFTQNREWTSNVCREIIKRGIQIPWSAETRCDRVDSELLKLMHSANCKALWFGVESFCSNVLKNNYKYENEEIGYNAIRLCRSNNIQPLQFIMIGAPGESVDSINETIQGLATLGEAYVESAMIATPRFGTKYYEMAKKQYDMLGQDFYSLMGIRGVVGNNMTPEILITALNKINNREYDLLKF